LADFSLTLYHNIPNSMWYPIKTASIFKFIFPKLLWSMPKQDKAALYLTFDDGPIPEITPWVLDLLKKYEAKATFFCIGRNAENNPEIYQRILEEGHAVGNHSYNHLNGWKTPLNTYVDNVVQCAAIVKSKLFRPPYGRISLKQISALQKINYKIVMWDVIAGDFDEKLSEEKCLKNILHFSKKGTILVLHDSKKAFPRLSYVLPRLLEHYSKLGFEFKPLKTP
jgi:peptidoglycan-N-acetylglucosamine deacetylase